MAKKVDNENSQDALVFASVAVAQVKLTLNSLDDARKDLDAAERILDSFDSVETVVHAAFYDASANYYQVCMRSVFHDRQIEMSANSLVHFSARWTLPITIVLRCSTWHA